MIKAIIFDFDGVLVESVDIKTAAFAKLFEEEGQDVIAKVVGYHLKNTGVSRYDKFKYIYREILKRPLRDEIFKNLCKRFADIVVDDVVKAPYVAGARGFLDGNSSKYKYFITSATPQSEIEEIIKRRNISHFFKKIYGAPVKKSDAVADVISREKIKRCHVLYVGDALSDYMAAKYNGIHFVARINDNEDVFTDIECAKIKDLSGLSEVIGAL